MEIGLAWDGSQFLIQPTCCVLLFFFVSPSTGWIFAALAAWAVYTYVIGKYLHLRMCKKAFTSTHRLDALMMWAWGLVQA